jgi:type IV pilus assembly protein PilY1
VLDAQTGAVLKEFVAPAGTLTSEAGVAQISAFGESDGTVRYVYGGDLLGNVWRIDLDQPSLGASAFTKIAQLRGPAGDVQPVTTAPELTSYSGLRIVYVGTGRLLDYTDFGDSKVQSMYAISDGALLTNARSSLVRQTYVSGSDTVATTPVDWSTQRGWYMDLPAGEQANTRPSVGLGALAFVTNTAGWSDCSASSRLYVLDVLTGGRFPRASFTTRLISDVANAGPVTLAVSRGGSKLLGITREFGTGNTGVEELGAISGVNAGKNAWREIRR